MVAISARSLAGRLVDWRAGHTLAYRALADRVRALVLDGRIPTDARLPAERDLAAQLGVSRTTVSAAYAELRETGWLVSRRGSGSIARLPTAAPSVEPDTAAGLLDFTKATMPAWRGVAGASVRAAELLPAELRGSGYDPVGLPVLRERIAQHYEARGLPTAPDQIVVTLGAQHAISLIAATVLTRGDRVLVENPSYPNAVEALRAAGGRLLPVPVGVDEGWDRDAIAEGLRRGSPTLAYLMPDCHNPTGRSMAEGMRATLSADARRSGTVLVVDETMRGLELDGPGHPPFAVHGGGTVTIGSLGKSVWGGLRIGWIRCPRELARRIVRGRAARDLGTPVIEQLIAAELVPELERILAERRETLVADRDHAVGALRRLLPDWTVPAPEGGLTVWASFERPLSSALALRAREEGLVIAPGPRFGVDGAFERFLRIPYSLRRSEVDAGIRMLARAWSAVLDRPAPTTQEEFAQIA